MESCEGETFRLNRHLRNEPFEAGFCNDDSTLLDRPRFCLYRSDSGVDECPQVGFADRSELKSKQAYSFRGHFPEANLDVLQCGHLRHGGTRLRASFLVVRSMPYLCARDPLLRFLQSTEERAPSNPPDPGRG